MNRHQRRRAGMITSKPGASRPSGHCHEIIAETAKAMAHEVFDELMLRNDWWKNWQEQNPDLSTTKELEARWVEMTWGKFISEARGALAHMLTTKIDENQKEQIMEALQLDHSLIRGRPRSGGLLVPAGHAGRH